MRARLPLLSSCHQQPLLLLRSRAGGKRAGRRSSQPPASPALRAAAGPAHGRHSACSWSPPGSRFPGPLPSCFARRREHSSPELQAISGFSPALRHRTLLRVSRCRLAAVFRGPSSEERALTAAIALAVRSNAFPAALQLQRGLVLGPFPGAGGAAGVPGARPQHPPPKFAFLLFRGGGSAPRGGRSLVP